jgi:hypothetical protein
MKKVIITLIALGSITGYNVNAQVGSTESDSTNRTNSTNYNNESASPSQGSEMSSPGQQQQADLIKIRASELPAMVTQTLGNSDYQGWSVVTAYRTSANDQYKVDVKKGTQTKSYWFDKNGNKLEAGSKAGSKTGTSGTGTGTSGSDTESQDGTSGSSGSGTTGTGTSGTGSSGSGTTGSGTGSGSSGTGTTGTGSGTTTDK